MMYTTECICQVKPTDTEGLPPSLSLSNDGQHLQVMFGATRYTINKGFLGGSIEEAIVNHVGQPPSLHQAGEHLAHTGCEGDGAEVGRIGGIIRCLLLAQ